MDTHNISCGLAPDTQISTASKLIITRAQYRLRYHTVNSEHFDKVVIGAAIFQSSMLSDLGETPRILLLKQSTHEIYYPNVFEVPSGNVDDNDIS
jgi:hypothetical protein